MKIKTGDTVVVIAGKDSKQVTKKGVESTTGKVLKVYPETNKVVVEGVNKVKKHQKPTQQNTQGQIVEMEAPIDASNVMILDPKTKTPTRVGYKMENGKKVRYAKKSGTVLDK
jgi:large subunit ribosomal protein L24